MGDEHYLSKIERNSYVVDKAPEEIRGQIIRNIKWCREMASRLSNLDYDQREEAIRKIHTLLDDDYERMGFSINNKESNNMHR